MSERVCGKHLRPTPPSLSLPQNPHQLSTSSTPTLLPFQRTMVEELLDDDGVTVMAAGLGVRAVAGALLRVHAARAATPGARGAALVMGAPEWLRDQLLEDVLSEEEGGGAASTSLSVWPPRAAIVTADTPAPQRAALYAAAAVAFVTTRILVVDLLNGVVSGADVGGVLVLAAHRCASPDCGEAFAARLARATNPAAWIRALSDAPAPFAAGFARPERVLRALGVRRLRLWPRFEARVKDALSAAKTATEVIELAVRMTSDMATIYEAIADLMEACLRELRRCTRLDATGLSLAAGVHPSFDAGILRQLDAVWHSVPSRVKQAAADLRTLRSLADELLTLDAVSFLRRLDALRAADAGLGGGWLLADAAHTVFAAAKRRVYVLTRPKRARGEGRGGGSSDAAAPSNSTAATVVPVLEELPKWGVVLDVLAEIQTAREALLVTPTPVSSAAAEARVVVVSRDPRTSAALASAAAAGGVAPVMTSLYDEYLAARLAGGGSARAAAAAAARAAGRWRGRGWGRRAAPTPAERLAAARAARLKGTPAEELALLRSARGGGRGGGGRGRGRGTGAAPPSPPPSRPPSPPPPPPAPGRVLHHHHRRRRRGRPVAGAAGLCCVCVAPPADAACCGMLCGRVSRHSSCLQRPPPPLCAYTTCAMKTVWRGMRLRRL